MNKISLDKLNSLKNIEVVLKDIIKYPSAYCKSKELILALESQSGIAKFSGNIVINDEVLNISPSSINTHKRQAELLFPEGYTYINELRVNALSALRGLSDQVENRRTKIGLYNTVKSQDKVMEYYKEEHLVWIQIIDRVKSDIRSISNTDDSRLRKRRAEEAIKKINSTLSLLNIFPDENYHSNNVHDMPDS